jgi:hypothetical protein
MKHSFKTTLGRPTFGVFKESQDASDYISRKKANILLSTRQSFDNTRMSFNTANLNVNLLTTLDLSGVSVLVNRRNPVNAVNPGAIKSTDVPYLDYQIDPCGNLFGYTACGLNNYELYMRYNPLHNTGKLYGLQKSNNMD